jgi:serine/threonine-protein kinase ATR
MNMHTIHCYATAMKLGSKYIYQTVPRLLTIWLDLGENASPKVIESDQFRNIKKEIESAIREVPAFKWFTAFPQIVSRIGHRDKDVYQMLGKLMIKVIGEYPNQALWLFASVIHSVKSIRKTRGASILDAVRVWPQRSPLFLKVHCTFLSGPGTFQIERNGSNQPVNRNDHGTPKAL